MLPNFIIIGAAKSGTTNLFFQIREHPDIFMPDNKELDFFIDDRYVGHWNEGVGYYEKWFEPWKGEKVVGEASPRYTMDPYYSKIPERMFGLLPDVRLIYILRNPLDQIWSFYRHQVFHEGQEKPLEELISPKGVLMATANYPAQLKKYYRYFSREQILIVLFEDYALDQVKTAQRIFRFLGVDPTVRITTDRIHNKTRPPRSVPRSPAFLSYLKRHMREEGLKKWERLLMKPLRVPRMSSETRQSLSAAFAAQRAELAKMTGLDFSRWAH